MIIKLPMRETDDFGSGHYKANRGSRKHSGIDYSCFAGSVAVAPILGIVTKLGYPYGDDLSYRYVEIKSNDNRFHRIFYVMPNCRVGDVVCKYTEIGTVQDIAKRYDTETKKMNNHIHYEIIYNGEYIDPEEYL